MCYTLKLHIQLLCGINSIKHQVKDNFRLKIYHRILTIPKFLLSQSLAAPPAHAKAIHWFILENNVLTSTNNHDGVLGEEEYHRSCTTSFMIEFL